MINEISKLAKDKPDLAQMLSASLGYAVDKIAGENGQQGGSISEYATKWNLFGDGHKNKKMTSVAIGIETEGLGHVSLIIGFEDGTYEEANFGRYGDNINRISSTTYASPIGGGTYAFDYNYIPSQDGKRLYFIDVDPNDVAYLYNTTIINNGYKLINKPIIIRQDVNKNDILSNESYRNSSYTDYNLFSNNCVTTSLNPIISLIKNNNTTVKLLRKVIVPSATENILRNLGLHDKTVKKVFSNE